MQLRYLGHSGIELTSAGFDLAGSNTAKSNTAKSNTVSFNLVIDPFLTGNPVATIKPETLSPQYIILTHAHGDHTSDVEPLAKRLSAPIISNFEIVQYYVDKGLNGHHMNTGGSFTFPFGKLTFTPAWHSSSFPDGSYGGNPMGVILELEGKRIYHAGDTALFSDMALIGKKGIDLALLPIGDNFTMGPEDALEAVKLLNPKQVIPVHYNTFGVIQQDGQAFKDKVESQTSARCIVLKPGESVDI
jgi:L-ascorbate metabolism protein UlaG (beta-lactamase superfamily)